jgi:hypothetical protein
MGVVVEHVPNASPERRLASSELSEALLCASPDRRDGARPSAASFEQPGRLPLLWRCVQAAIDPQRRLLVANKGSCRPEHILACLGSPNQLRVRTIRARGNPAAKTVWEHLCFEDPSEMAHGLQIAGGEPVLL